VWQSSPFDAKLRLAIQLRILVVRNDWPYEMIPPPIQTPSAAGPAGTENSADNMIARRLRLSSKKFAKKRSKKF
jgi:hypothetical protein